MLWNKKIDFVVRYLVVFVSSSHGAAHSKVGNFDKVLRDNQYVTRGQITVHKTLCFKVTHPFIDLKRKMIQSIDIFGQFQRAMFDSLFEMFRWPISDFFMAKLKRKTLE